MQFRIGSRDVGPGYPTLIVAELGLTHDGSLDLAYGLIDAVAEAGADAVKFQTHLAEFESTAAEPFRIRFSRRDPSRYAYWKRMEFSAADWTGLAAHAADKGLIFLSSPFSVEAVALLEATGVPAWKIASGEVSNPFLLDAVAATGKPVLLSSGMSDWVEIEAAVDRLRTQNVPLALFQCTSQYPARLEDLGLNVMDELRARFSLPVGLSDHSGNPHAAMTAVARGADLVEVHVCLHKTIPGPDVPASLTLDQLAALVRFRDDCWCLRTHPVDKDAVCRELAPLRAIFTKSLALRADQTVGAVLESAMLTARKPGTGIPASQAQHCVGRKLVRDVSAARVLEWSDLEP